MARALSNAVKRFHGLQTIPASGYKDFFISGLTVRLVCWMLRMPRFPGVACNPGLRGKSVYRLRDSDAAPATVSGEPMSCMSLGKDPGKTD